jgi:hypothetical protein
MKRMAEAPTQPAAPNGRPASSATRPSDALFALPAASARHAL